MGMLWKDDDSRIKCDKCQSSLFYEKEVKYFDKKDRYYEKHNYYTEIECINCGNKTKLEKDFPIINL